MSPKSYPFDRKPKNKPLLSVDYKRLIFAALIRDRDLWDSFQSNATVADFQAEEDKVYGIIWASLENLTKTELPFGFKALVTEVSQRINEDTDYLDSEQADELNIILEEARVTSRTQFREQQELITSSLRQYLRELVQKRLAKEVHGSDSLIQLPELLSNIELRLSTIDSAGAGVIGVPFPDGDDEEQATIAKITTKCDYLDHYMGGGQAGGEVYGFCAPYGVCKTLQACQLGVGAVQVTQAAWNQGGRATQLPKVYLFFYEEPESSVKIRLLSCFAQVDRNTLELPKSQQKLSTRKLGDYKDYERRIWGEHIGAGMAIPGEAERVKMARMLMNRNLVTVFLNGAKKEFTEQAGNSVPGIVNIIREHQRHCGNPGVAMVCVDYAGAVADRYLERKELDTDQLRHIIGRMPLRLKNQVAAPYNCPVWLFHQLSASANSLAPGVAPKRNDTAEAKNFFEHCDFGFMVGMKTDDTSLAVLTNAKQRRQEKRRDMVIKIDGVMCSMRSASQDYTIENNRIISTAELSRIADLSDDDDDKDSEYGGGLPAFEDFK